MVSRELAKKLSDSIRTGKLEAGTLLPPTRRLAAKYRVSVGTVQVALRELETQRLIQCIPRKGAYIRGVAQHLTGTIRLIAALGMTESSVPEGADMFTSRILHSATESLYPDGHSLLALAAGISPDWFEAFVARLDKLGSELAGVIAFVRPEMPKIYAELDRRRIKHVTLGQFDTQAKTNLVAADNEVGARLAGICFAKMGLQRVVLLGNSPTASISTMQKIKGFFQGYFEQGVSTQALQLVTCPNVEEMSGYVAMKSHIASHGPPEGVFAEGDLLARGAITALQESGARVPEDTSVIGCTGLHLAEQMAPTLSVVAQPMEAMGVAIARMMRQLIEEDLHRVPAVHVPTRLNLRDSVAASIELRQEIESAQLDISAV